MEPHHEAFCELSCVVGRRPTRYCCAFDHSWPVLFRRTYRRCLAGFAFFCWVGTQQVPITIRISGNESSLRAEFLNGPADHPDATPASSVTFDGTHLIASFDYFARTLDATLTDGKLGGTYGPTHPTAKTAPTPFIATRGKALVDPASAPNAPDISGSWEIATKSSKGESAWEFRTRPAERQVLSGHQDRHSTNRWRPGRPLGNLEWHQLYREPLQRGAD